MNPDAAFLRFFAGPWQAALDRIEIPGMPGASWDRKAAYLLYATHNGDPAEAVKRVLSSAVTKDGDIFS